MVFMCELFFGSVLMVSCSTYEDLYLYFQFDLFHMGIYLTFPPTFLPLHTHNLDKCGLDLHERALHAKIQLIDRKYIIKGNGKCDTATTNSTWNWNYFFFVPFLIISIYCSRGLKTINVTYNKTNSLLLLQNNWWNPPEEPISSRIEVSSSSLKQLLLSWQLTQSGLSKVYHRNRVKEQVWSQKLCPWHPEHEWHIAIRCWGGRLYHYGPHSSTFMSTAILTLIKHVAQKDKAVWGY